MIDLLKAGDESARVAIDFMEGEVRGRTSGQVVLIDSKFVANRMKVKMRIGPSDIGMFVPDYVDYFILKVVSGRLSDVRDIAALVWKKSIPDNLERRMVEMLPTPSIFRTQLADSIIPDISDAKFIDSWRGTFVTTAFDDEVREDVLSRICGLLL